MPPKKRISACIPDVLNQPLQAIPQAIKALLSRPGGLDHEEAVAVMHEAVNIMERCEVVLDSINGSADPHSAVVTAEAVITTCFRLLSAAFIATPEVGEIGLSHFAATAALWTSLKRIFLAVVFSASVGELAQLEVLQVIDVLCDGAATKELAGESFTDHLRVMMADRDVPMLVHREVATALINLVKCSKKNKSRLGDMTEIVEALNTTIDFFLQLQCVELMYRVLRQNKALLSNFDLPPRLVRGIGSLPNDSRLLEQMVAVLEDWNTTREPRFILKFNALRVDVAGENICPAASLYFSPEHLLILLGGSVSDNISVSYKQINSVKLHGRECKVAFALAEVPLKLAGRCEVGDSVTVTMSQAALREFRKSDIHQWIVSVLRMKGQDPSPLGRVTVGASPQQQQTNITTVAAVTPTTATTAKAAAKSSSSKKTKEQKRLAELANLKKSEEQPQPQSHQPLAEIPMQLEVGGGEEDEAPAKGKKRNSGGKRARTGVVSDAMNALTVDLAATAEKPPQDQQSPATAFGQDVSMCVAPSPVPFRNVSESKSVSATKKARAEVDSAVSTASSAAVVTQSGGDMEVDDLIGQLRAVIDDKIAAKREEAAKVLSDTMGNIQSQVDAHRKANKALREDYKLQAAAQLQCSIDAQEEVRSRVVEVVTKLNGQMQDLKGGCSRMRDQVSCFAIEYPPAILETKAEEDEFLLGLKQMVEEDMAELEARVNRRVAETNPVRFLTSFISKKLDTETVV